MYIAQVFKFKHELWRYIVGFFVVFGLGSQIIGMVPLLIAILYKQMSEGSVNLSDEKMIFTLFDSNIMLPILLFSFVVGFIFLWLWVKHVHQQPFKTLYSANSRLNWKKIWFSFIVCTLLVIISTGIDYYISSEDYTLNFKLIPFLILFIVGTLLIPIQASFEEFLFRGYLMQGIGAAAKNKWVPLVITSILFGMMHIFNPEVDKIGYIIMISYIGMGFFFGIITLMDEGLELAVGYHVANNLITALLVTADWTAFQTHSIFKYTGDPTVGWDVFIPIFVVLPIIILVFAKKYKWRGWKEKLFGKIEKPVTVNNQF
ncbi:CPBP family intramembrane glutamic endopeptidase [Abyssalbus ytuae]|uniref:CPBP family intramembrane metalloprotease n=1 Tax=Abyssalbus ytuae TaxID=2926907 RepID=A0A9E6ZMZ4_9FLAO|nr:CPBP family intramembrane glutamic endopeptidase [Abyssalbus ytuae]UOB17315.1 CPBP family intramembrane metalloprotease [Abyssalbus ytuae]